MLDERIYLIKGVLFVKAINSGQMPVYFKIFSEAGKKISK